MSINSFKEVAELVVVTWVRLSDQVLSFKGSAGAIVSFNHWNGVVSYHHPKIIFRSLFKAP